MSIVLKDFQCKTTKKIYRAGEAYDGKREKELKQLGYVGDEDSSDDSDPKPDKNEPKGQ